MTKRSDQGPLGHLRGELEGLARVGLLRSPPAARDETPPGWLNLCSNDYLGYAASRRLASYARSAAEGRWTGASASRLVAGEHRAHRELEAVIADWLVVENALLFTSGYAANVGAIAALAGEGDLIVSDALNHASIIDGCRLSRARTVVVPHLDVDGVRKALRGSDARRRWVIAESYFSMDGDSPDLSALRSACDEQGAALVLDESHAIGVYGPEGRGLAAASGVEPDVLVGTLGKALGGQGAFVAGSHDLCAWLWNRARSFVFSTGLSPMLAAVGRGGIELARADDTGREKLEANATALREGLVHLGARVPPGSKGPIIPVVVGEASHAVALSNALREMGIEVQAIRPPTVAKGSARLRVTASTLLTSADIERALAAFAGVFRS